MSIIAHAVMFPHIWQAHCCHGDGAL